MSNKTYLGYNAERLETAPAFLPYSKVVAWYDDENAFVAGDDSGRTLEVDLPFATQKIVDGMLNRIRGYRYQPWTGTGALLDPAAELGDGVTVNGVYSVLASVDTMFDALMVSEAAAPADDEVDFEFPWETPTNRQLRRKVTLGASYYGTTITRARGLEITRTNADGTTGSRALLNSDVFALYNDDGREALYFDTNAGKFKFRGDVYVTGGTMNINNNFVVDANGNVTLNGNINLSGGTITWGKNDPADGTGISDDECRTIIGEEMVSSPNIAGGKFWDIDQTTRLEMGLAGTKTAYLNHYASVYGSSPVCVMGYIGSGIYPSWVISPFGRFALEFQYRGGSYPYTYAYGTWDFSNATAKGMYLRFS